MCASPRSSFSPRRLFGGAGVFFGGAGVSVTLSGAELPSACGVFMRATSRSAIAIWSPAIPSLISSYTKLIFPPEAEHSVAPVLLGSDMDQAQWPRCHGDHYAYESESRSGTRQESSHAESAADGSQSAESRAAHGRSRSRPRWQVREETAREREGSGFALPIAARRIAVAAHDRQCGIASEARIAEGELTTDEGGSLRRFDRFRVSARRTQTGVRSTHHLTLAGSQRRNVGRLPWGSGPRPILCHSQSPTSPPVTRAGSRTTAPRIRGSGSGYGSVLADARDGNYGADMRDARARSSDAGRATAR